MSIPQDITKRETVAAYILEAVTNLKAQDVLKLQLKEIKDSVKESGLIDSKEFNSAVQSAYSYEAQQDKLDAIQRGLDIVDELKI